MADLAGFGFGVEWCVVGLDRNGAYNPACRMAQALQPFARAKRPCDGSIIGFCSFALGLIKGVFSTRPESLCS